ncbi:stress-inducible protein [Actinidia rufa]|uniref:Stress-inducible protein n=1 Tax=Actinidia rufa TaxID=165716 RepID=A0A7J0G568_9ERIC|nr:stress-inducible protein [Actinidia rufa]
MWARLESDPTTRAFLQQGDFKNKMLDVQENPSTLNRHLKDPRIVQALGVLLNVKLRRPNSTEDADIPDAEMTEEEPEPEDMEVPEEEREARERKKEAHKEKEKGNAAYEKDFEAAIQHYAKAIELNDNDISFLTNRAVVYLEMGQDEAAAAEEEEAFDGGLSRARHRVVLGLGINTSDYEKLEVTLKGYGVPTVVAKVSRIDWLRNAAGLADPNYWWGTLRPRSVLDWYLKRVDEAVNEANKLAEGRLLSALY